jgi:hypothetical protein
VKCPGVPLVWPCVLPQWRPCVTGLGVRKRSRRLQHPLHCVFGDAANCPGVPLVWPCVLPQWRLCVTGLGVRKISRGDLQHPLGVVWRHCCGVPRRFPCLVLRASSVETLHHRTCKIRKRSRRLHGRASKPLNTSFPTNQKARF